MGELPQQRINGHTPKWWKRHSPPQYTKQYNRQFARSMMKLFLANQSEYRRLMQINQGKTAKLLKGGSQIG